MNGIYLINKPIGITSHDVVDYLRRVTGEKTVGHAGTLDPLASGLMIVAIGREFTKRISEFIKLDKDYVAIATLGSTSTTYDAEGEIIPSGNSKSPGQEEIIKTLQSFIGAQEQMPPIFSAKKVGGKKAYDLARQGKEVKLKPVPVTIHKIELLDYQYPILKFNVKVSSGTYIRSLINDIGQKLGVGAYMSGLVRTKIGDYTLSQATDLHRIASINDLAPVRI
ncbi:MAG: tRNA pseudouridine(55) synthase TruB [Patescibacteria group bacterium]